MPESSGARVEKGAATGKFTLASWDEDTYETLESGGKLTRATVTQPSAATSRATDLWSG